MELKFETRIWETANVNVVTVPKAFIKHGLLNPEKRYVFTIHESPDLQEQGINGLRGILSLKPSIPTVEA